MARPAPEECVLKSPDHAARRTVIREWMALPRDKRKTADQAMDFASQAAGRHALHLPDGAAERIAVWLAPRVGRD